MLSCDPLAPVNGQAPPSSNNISNGTQAIPSSSNTAYLSMPVVSGDTKSTGVVSTATDLNGHGQHAEHHIWLVTGPAGCGKSTVAEYLAEALSLPYIEGDEFHTPANIEKMGNGIPLTDADRWDWLVALREESIRKLDAGYAGAVVTCSALKRKYRDVIRVAPYFVPNLHLHFIYLHAPAEVLLKRVFSRQNHYMGANMVHSQLDILEPPAPDETDVVRVDVSRSAEEVKADVLDNVLKVMDANRS